MAEKIFERAQIGIEATPGTPVSATVLLGATARIPDSDREVIVPSVGLGRRMPWADAAYVRTVGVSGVGLESGDGVVVQVLPHLLAAAIANPSAPTEQTAGEGDYLWTSQPTLTGAPTARTLTVEAGTDAVVYQLPYGIVTQLELSGSAPSGEASLSAQLDAQRVAILTPGWSAAVIPGASGVPAFLSGALARLYVDGSEVADALVDWQVRLETGLHPKRVGGGSLTYVSHGQSAVGLTLSVSVERTDAVSLIDTAYRDDTAATHEVQLVVDSGRRIGAGLTHRLTITLHKAALVSLAPFSGDNDGNAVDGLTWQAGYTAGGTAFAFEVVTDVDAL